MMLWLEAIPTVTGYLAMTEGFMGAADRLHVALRNRSDPKATFIPLFETLNWLVAIDDRLRSEGHEWNERALELMSAVRYIRGRVHHQWAEAFELREDIQLNRCGSAPPRPPPVRATSSMRRRRSTRTGAGAMCPSFRPLTTALRARHGQIRHRPSREARTPGDRASPRRLRDKTLARERRRAVAAAWSYCVLLNDSGSTASRASLRYGISSYWRLK